MPRSLIAGIASCALAVAPALADAQGGKAKPPAPLAGFASQRVNVMPLQLFRADTSALVTAAVWPAVRKELDDSIGSAISARGVGKNWAYAADVARAARRNAAYVSDPYSLGAQPLRNATIKPGDKVPDVFASNLRSLIAIGDTRFALVPVELVFVRSGSQLRPVLRIVLVDGRAGLFVWAGEVSGEPGPALTAGAMALLAARVADLVAQP